MWQVGLLVRLLVVLLIHLSINCVIERLAIESVICHAYSFLLFYCSSCISVFVLYHRCIVLLYCLSDASLANSNKD